MIEAVAASPNIKNWIAATPKNVNDNAANIHATNVHVCITCSRSQKQAKDNKHHRDGGEDQETHAYRPRNPHVTETRLSLVEAGFLR